jgi:hypothetical protein
VYCIRATVLYLLENVQKGLGVKGAKVLAADMLTEEDILGIRRKFIILGSRGKAKSQKPITQHTGPL